MKHGTVVLGVRLSLGSLLVLWGATGAAHVATAASRTLTFGVSLTISAACTVSAAPGAFSAQSTANPSAFVQQAVSVACTNPAPYTVEIGQPATAFATATPRSATDPASAADGYGLYRVTVSF